MYHSQVCGIYKTLNMYHAQVYGIYNIGLNNTFLFPFKHLRNLLSATECIETL
jgi:hypothetical protein